jgi:hypothetical protein
LRSCVSIYAQRCFGPVGFFRAPLTDALADSRKGRVMSRRFFPRSKKEPSKKTGSGSNVPLLVPRAREGANEERLVDAKGRAAVTRLEGIQERNETVVPASLYALVYPGSGLVLGGHPSACKA